MLDILIVVEGINAPMGSDEFIAVAMKGFNKYDPMGRGDDFHGPNGISLPFPGAYQGVLAEERQGTGDKKERKSYCKGFHLQ